MIWARTKNLSAFNQDVLIWVKQKGLFELGHQQDNDTQQANGSKMESLR